ncbi:carbohydrate-binding protein [Reichenbachiella ulvae]|uniref:Carbohydrate-binding protein n=1 Tax=Reichenbachiella ulvae TaxID=2980104 RepID=A0ABT3CUN5_9BACT|nr:carbohydrate-binding protein [Reichenbachiella ulvae]MCV9387411.1 carbohydrate-binding protein [Reichenbachiella ulvae]
MKKILQLMKVKLQRTALAIAFLWGMGVMEAQPISPMLVGNNAWYTNPTDEVWALTGECGVKTIRIGGNGFNDNMPSNATLLSWIKKIRAIGAEPIVQVSQHQSAAVAAGVVKYLNVDMSAEIAPIKYWNIGNEPWLEANRPNTSEVAPLVEAYFKPIAEAMKEVDPTIKIYGPDFAYYIEDAINDLFGGANDIAGKIPGKDYYYCDGISWHRYPQDENINLAYEGIEDFKTSIVKCKAKVDAINASYNRTGDDALQWGIGEYNAKGGPQVHTWENGQMFGGVLGLCMKYEATYAATWSMFENGGSRTGTDFSFIDGANMTPRSSYRHMEFVAKYFTGNYLEGTTSHDDIIVYGAQEGSRTSVMIMNRESGAPLKYTLHLNADAIAGEHVVLTVDGALDKSYSDIIGEKTTHVIVFDGETITKYNYSSDHFEKEQAPVMTELGSVTELPMAPSGIEQIGAEFDRVEIGWVDNADNESGFIIERKIGETFEVVGLVDADVNSFVETGLTAETSYTFRLLSYNSLGESDYTEALVATTSAVPAQVAYNGPHAIPGRIQAEDYNDNPQGLGYNDAESENQGGAYRTSEGVDIEACTDEGAGFNIGYVTEGEWLNYLIADVAPGTYDIAFRLASNSTSTDTKKITVRLNEQLLGTVTPAVTGGWQEWETKYIEGVNIVGGSNQLLELSFSGSGFNINWFEFQEKSVVTGAIDPGLSNLIYYDAGHKLLKLELNEQSDRARISVHDLSGRIHFKNSYRDLQSTQIHLGNLPEGLYIVKLKEMNQTTQQKIWVY